MEKSWWADGKVRRDKEAARVAEEEMGNFNLSAEWAEEDGAEEFFSLLNAALMGGVEDNT